MHALRSLLCAALLLGSTPLWAKNQLQEEYRTVLWKIAQNIHHLYYEEVDPDTLMRAAARGMFAALDPGSEYTLQETADSGERDQALGHRFYTLMQMAESIDQNALYNVTPDTLVRFGIAGMMEVLDPYTIFLEKRNLDNFHIQTQGHYGGLGFRIQVVYPDSAIAVWTLLHQQTPAARAGVRSGDLIRAIDGESTRGMSAGDAADKMRGKAGTPVTLTLERAGRPTTFDLKIVREEVQMNSVPYYTLFEDGTGYIKLTRFQHKSSQEVRDAIAELQAKGMQRLIFDLRGNGGGYLQEAVEIADLFLPKDRLVVFTAGRAFADTSKYYTRTKALLDDEPLVVLVDRQSASASEIIAGAIQDWDRGLILGTPTVGKGSVQQTVNIDDKAELKLTMAAWHTPSGRSIDKRMRKDSTLVKDSDKLFKTLLLERGVRGGGGITPDVFLQGRKGSLLFSQLSGYHNLNSQFFYFSRHYVATHPELTPAFRADAQTLGQFRAFATGRHFAYESEAEAHLKKLEEKITAEEDYKRLEKPLKRLIAEVDEIEEKHWTANLDLFQWKLTFDILEKAFGIEAAYAYDAEIDPQVQRARQILASPIDYESWFQKKEIGAGGEDAIAHEIERDDVQ